MTHNLTYVEQRGWLTVWNYSRTATVTLAGWFMLGNDGFGVVRRRVGGRNRWSYTNLDWVVDFRPDPAAK